MMDVEQMLAIEKGAISVRTTGAYADRVKVPGVLEGSQEQRVSRLREAALREIDSFVETVPSVRLKDGELAAYRGTLGDDEELEGALRSLLVYKEGMREFVDFLFVLRGEVYALLEGEGQLSQAAVDDAVLAVLTPWAIDYGYSGIRTIDDRDTASVFAESVSRGELQYDYFFKGQLFEIVAAPGFNIHGHFPHVLQWLYFSWRHDRERPREGGVSQAIAAIYRRVPQVGACEMFRRLSDTFNSPVQLQLRSGQAPNFKAMAVNYRGFPRSLTDPASITRLFEIVLYNSLDPAREVVLEPMQVMVARPGPAEELALYEPETEDEARAWAERSRVLASA